MMKSIASTLFVLATALLVSSHAHAGYANGMNQYAAYHVMHGGVDPSGMISLSTVRHQDVGAGMSLPYLEQGNNAVDLLDTVEFRGREENGREIKDLDSGVTMDSLQNRETCCNIWIRWSDEDTWYPLDLDDSNMRVMRAAGNAVVKLTCGVSSGENGDLFSTESASVELEIRFPDALSIYSNSSVRQRMDQEWKDSLKNTTATNRREYGYYITLDTSSGNYGTAGYTVGENFAGGGRANLRHFPDPPADKPASPTPVGTATYTVAWFHTHPSEFFLNRGKPNTVGASGGDAGFSVGVGLPGFAYDYAATTTHNGHPAVPENHPLMSQGTAYHASNTMQRRKTPH